MMKNPPVAMVRGSNGVPAMGPTPGDRSHLSNSRWTPE